ncbi:hypothetical protein [Pantoea septica]|uniref:hypothetical protein n=1 Tax=Pantoea septica TaxID=472695 RepID=UPI003CFCE716
MTALGTLNVYVACISCIMLASLIKSIDPKFIVLLDQVETFFALWALSVERDVPVSVILAHINLLCFCAHSTRSKSSLHSLQQKNPFAISSPQSPFWQTPVNVMLGFGLLASATSISCCSRSAASSIGSAKFMVISKILA